MICKKLIQHQPMRPSPCSSVWIFFQNFAVSFENAMEGQGVGRFYSEKWNNTTIKKHLALRRKLIQRMNGSSKIRFR
ncbi:unnamed protein product [Rhizophagus irregularis]|nr:unnamed protein product [Rhizophagus irregularis]